MFEFASHPEGVVLAVKARAGARSNALRGVRQGRLLVSVTQAPERGKANEALLDLLSAALRLKRSQVTLIAGAASTEKKFLIRGLAPAEAARRVQSALESP